MIFNIPLEDSAARVSTKGAAGGLAMAWHSAISYYMNAFY